MWLIVLITAILSDPAAAKPTSTTAPRGTLIAVGGGTTTVEIMNHALEQAGGTKANVAIIPAADPENGPASLALWQSSSAKRVDLVDLQNPIVARKLVQKADLIWMPGGLQGILMRNLDGTGLEEVIRQRYQAGAVIGGTSAGAAALCKIMIGGRSDLDHLTAGTAPYLRNGLELWPEVIIDQHFLQKGRFNRLALAVIDHPDLIGIGIDEETAVIVRGDHFDVIGDQCVTVIDGRKSSREKLVDGQPAAIRDLRVHVLRAGMSLDLNK